MRSVRLILAGVAVLVFVASALGIGLAFRLTSAPKAVDLATWADRMCGADLAYSQAILGAVDGVSPQSLELEARKQRGARIGKVQVDAATAMLAALKAMQPPEAARVLHEALVREKEEELAATVEQLEAVAKASTAQQIAVANANVRFRRESQDQNTSAALANLGADVQAALKGAPNCNRTPGAPPPVAPAPGA